MLTSEIITKIRYLANEGATNGSDIFIYEGQDVFKLGEDNTIDVSAVYQNDVELSESNNWAYNSASNRITFESGIGLSTNDVLEVQYTFYPNFSDAEITSYIQNALIRLDVYGFGRQFEIDGTEISPTPTTEEANIIALAATLLMKPSYSSIRLPELSLVSGGKSPSVEELIQQSVVAFKARSKDLIVLTEFFNYMGY